MSDMSYKPRWNTKYPYDIIKHQTANEIGEQIFHSNYLGNDKTILCGYRAGYFPQKIMNEIETYSFYLRIYTR